MNDTINEKGFIPRGTAHYVLYDANGNIKEERTVHNLITDVGFDFVADALADGSGRPAVMDYIAIGDDTPSAAPDATQTALQNELARQQGTYSHTVGTKSYTVVTTFGPGVGTGAIQESGMFNAGAGGTMFNRQTFAVINKGANDSLQVTWQINLSEGP